MEIIITDSELYTAQDLTPKTRGSAGIDLKSCQDLTLEPNESAMIDSGLRIWLELPGLVAFVLPRSSLGTKGLIIGNGTGVIDSDYQGPLLLSLWNRSGLPFTIQRGERVAQLLVMPVHHPEKRIVEKHFSFETSRAQNGFGSTGKH